MALKFIFFHFITAMVAVNLIFADDEPDRAFGLPFFGGGGDNGSGLPFGLPFFGGNRENGSSGLPNLPFFDQLPSFFGSRPERSAEPQEENEDAPQERQLFASIVSCNFTEQGGTNCLGCRQSLACYPNNVGRLRTCRGLLRYCNNGRCALAPEANCTGTA